MQTKKIDKKKIILASTMSVLLAIVLALSGVGIYLKVTHKEKAPAEIVNPLDFSIDAWDGKTIDGINFNEDYAGRGTQTKTINSAASFIHFINEVNSGNNFENHKIYLNKNIDLKGHTIESIGTFKGTFDGGFYTILNANINGDGLFGETENATIKNIGLYNANTNLINKAVNTNIENCFVRLGNGLLVNEYISNNGEHYITNSFVDSEADGLINKLNTNNSSENRVTISNCYFTNGEEAIKEMKAEDAVKIDKVINATNKTDFMFWSYSKEYSNEYDWCDYDYLENSQKLDFTYPLQTGFVKVYLTGSCYESVMVTDGNAIDTANLAQAFTEADKESEAEVNLLVEKIFMEAQAEVSNADIKVNALEDTTIVRGKNNTESMFVAKGNSKLTIGDPSTTAQDDNVITLDGNREYIESKNLGSNALVVAYGGDVEICDNVIFKNNINNSEVAYGGAILLYNTNTVTSINADFYNCHSENGGGAVAVVGTTIDSIGSCYNCSSNGPGGAIYLVQELPSEETQAMRRMYGQGLHAQPTADEILVPGIRHMVEDGTDLDSSYDGIIFNNCHSTEEGGAIYGIGDLTISGNISFQNNTTTYFGGAIYCVGNLTLSGTVSFESNYVNGYYSAGFSSDSGCGGAIYCESEVLISGNVSFDSNIANSNSFLNDMAENEEDWWRDYFDAYGGAIYSLGDVAISGDQIVSFSNNQTVVEDINYASGYGGAIYTEGNVTIGSYRCVFDTNSNDAIICDVLNINPCERNEIEFISNAVTCGTLNLNQAMENEQGETNSYVEFSNSPISVAGDVLIANNAWFHDSTNRAITCEYIEITGSPLFDSNSVTGENGGAISCSSIKISGSPIFQDNFCNYVLYDYGSTEDYDHYGYDGGAISASVSVTFSPGANAKFLNNKSSLNMIDCPLSENSGGAIDVKNGTLTVENGSSVYFNSNKTSNYGGAIYARDVNIYGKATFDSNLCRASYDPYDSADIPCSSKGGAIYATNVLLSGEVLFNSNSASGNYGNGGSVCAENITIEGKTEFKENEGKFGGAISAGNLGVNAEVLFESNTAVGYGGAVSVISVAFNEKAKVTFKSNKSEQNGVAYGGAIHGKVTCNTGSYVEFDDNKVNGSLNVAGGAINGDTTIRTGSTVILKNNSVKTSGANQYTARGGAIYAADLTIEEGANVEIDSNEAKEGGGVYAAESVVVNGEVNFTSNKATMNGGAIAYSINSTITISSDAVFKSNTASASGGAIYGGEKAEITISGDAVFESNIATNCGGAIFLGAIVGSQRSIITISGDAVFKSNRSHRGGALWASPGSTITISGNVEFESNTTEDKGGAIYGESEDGSFSTITISGDAVFESNTATNDGGAIYGGPLLNLTISGNAKFISNKAIRGAAIYKNSGSTLTISGDAVFDSNTADSYGGAIYFYSAYFASGSLIISGNSTFNSNTASESGGAIYGGGNDSTTIIEEGAAPIFTENEATCGGAIYGASSSEIKISGNAKFISNTASADGGAIYGASNSKITIGFATFESNMAEGEGEAIYSDYGLVISDIVTLKNNFDASNPAMQFEIYFSDYMELWYDLNILTTDPNVVAIYIPSDSYIDVKMDLTKSHTVYKEDATYFISNNVNSYICSFSEGNLEYTTDFIPFHVVNMPTDANGNPYTMEYGAYAPEFGYISRIVKEVGPFSVTITSSNTDYGTVATGIIYDVAYGTRFATEGNILTIGSQTVTATIKENSQYRGLFVGWSETSGIVEKNMTITANFNVELRTYTITWENENGTVLEIDENVEYGTTPSYDGITPTKAADAQYTYTFAGWNPEVSSVSGEETYVAVYTKTINKYTVTWKNENGTVLETDENVEYGTIPSYEGDIPTKIGNAQYSYVFKGWTPNLAKVTGDIIYTASFEEVVNAYKVTFLVNNSAWGTLETVGLVDNEIVVEYGTTIENDNNIITVADARVVPKSEQETNQFKYSFVEWLGLKEEVTIIDKDMFITAIFNEIPVKYRVGFDLNEDEYGTVSKGYVLADYGTEIIVNENQITIGENTIIATPNEMNAQYVYEFTGWTIPEDATSVNGEIVITANFKRIEREYKIIIQVQGNGSVDVSEVANIKYGTTIVVEGNVIRIGDKPITATANDGYVFDKWTGVVGSVEGDLTITAVFS